ncbi:AAA family ATPase [Catenuloplanes atrovinosus]|uniref:Orc1-like AAA ATPase domain-containing protein n=1 Tax=Catenuloplanes atrovinosus TaxID=137266 RepID=A0AAE4C7G5_9ACTN|nr:AAA family ATPase [Catenuloplanes atrovinosus]MDR7274511.1 hypothetical protein [Catenuloplanes atrovinosus]
MDTGGHLVIPRPRPATVRPGSLGERLRAARDRVFVGRERELAAFRSLLRDGGTLCLHGPGGIGKSTLLRRLADEARDAGRAVAEVDGRTLDPTPAAFAAEVSRAGGPAPVLLVDAFEHCQGLEGWLREAFLPRLPERSVVVIAGREPFSATSRELGDLSAEEAARLLEVRGVPAESRAAVLSFTGGHPLALSLAATLPPDALPSAGPPWCPGPEVLASLLGTLIGEVPSGAYRRALEICAHAPHTTEALLAAVLGGVDAGALLAWLRSLPFAETGRHGVALHEMVREAIDADLRWRDPTGYERMHHAIGDHLLTLVRDAATPAETLTATRALVHLQRYGPAAAWQAMLPQHGGGYEDGLRPGDHAAIVEMTRAAEGEESAAIVTHWLRVQPESFRVYRHSADDAPAGFLLWLRLPAGSPDAVAADPVATAAWAHAERTRPLGAGEHVGITRFMIDGAAYDALTSAMHVLQQRVYAMWIRSDRLAWTYVPAVSAAKWEPLLALVGHHPVDATATIGGRHYTLFGCDWRVTASHVWFGLTAPAATSTSSPTQSATALSRPDFDAAVRDALRDFHRPASLASSPLLRTRMIAASPRPASPVDARSGAGPVPGAGRHPARRATPPPSPDANSAHRPVPARAADPAPGHRAAPARSADPATAPEPGHRAGPAEVSGSGADTDDGWGLGHRADPAHGPGAARRDLAREPEAGLRATPGFEAESASASASAEESVEALRELLIDAVDGLREDPQDARLHRVVATTFFHRLPTQVAAAERLGLSFSTYRRHLHRGIERVCERLWQRESATE